MKYSPLSHDDVRKQLCNLTPYTSIHESWLIHKHFYMYNNMSEHFTVISSCTTICRSDYNGWPLAKIQTKNGQSIQECLVI